MTKTTIDFACKKCLSIQQKDNKRSNENWRFYDSADVCQCGGKYSMRIDGEFL